MRKIFNLVIDFFDYKYLELISFILIIFWAISPIIEFFLKYYARLYHTLYFVFIIYFVGIVGILEYIIYTCKRVKDKSFNIRSDVPQVLIFILFVLAIISTICSNDSHLSFFGSTYQKEGLIGYTMYMGFVLSSLIIEDKKYIKKILKVIIISSLFITIGAFSFSFFKYEYFSNVFHHFNHYGYYLMICSMLSGFMFVSIDGIKRFFYLLVYVFLVYLLIRNNTFGCYLAMFITLIFSFIYSLIKKHRIIDIIALVVLFLLVSFSISHYSVRFGNSSKDIVTSNVSVFSNDIKKAISNEKNIGSIGTGRWLLWEEAWNYTLEHPIIGGGMDCLRDYYLEKNIRYSDRPHNDILLISSFIGIPGAIIYFVLIFYLAVGNLKKIGNNSINIVIYFTSMCYFISSLFANSMYYTSPYFMILLGFLIGMLKEQTI